MGLIGGVAAAVVINNRHRGLGPYSYNTHYYRPLYFRDYSNSWRKDQNAYFKKHLSPNLYDEVTRVSRCFSAAKIHQNLDQALRIIEGKKPAGLITKVCNGAKVTWSKRKNFLRTFIHLETQLAESTRTFSPKEMKFVHDAIDEAHSYTLYRVCKLNYKLDSEPSDSNYPEDIHRRAELERKHSRWGNLHDGISNLVSKGIFKKS